MSTNAGDPVIALLSASDTGLLAARLSGRRWPLAR
jgi:hypothetical protein